MTAVPVPEDGPRLSPPRLAAWAEIRAVAPAFVDTATRYLVQIDTILAPTSVKAADETLRTFGRWMIAHTDLEAVADLGRADLEDFKVWLAARPGVKGPKLSKNSQRQRLRMLRVFFERLIEWDWPDAPIRNPLLAGDIPPRPEPLPQALDDRDAAKLIAAARAATDLRDRVIVETLARTGLRAGELRDLAADAIVVMGDAHWLRVPVGKLRNDRYIPLLPDLVELLEQWCVLNIEAIRFHRRLIADHRGPISYDTLRRTVQRVAKAAAVGPVRPHQLRHTLATQAINRGMRLEAIAELLGHRSMEMTLTYARIANRVVADEYVAVSEQLDAIYGTTLPADLEPARMAKLRHEAHARMLGNGLCTRPVELDCRMESACETCSYFSTGPEFVPVLLRQRDHAKQHGHPERAELFDGLIIRANKDIS